MPSHKSSLISELFDFKKNHWVSLHEQSASHSLDKELEFYELLNLNAPGDEGVNLDVDSSLDSMLHVSYNGVSWPNVLLFESAYISDHI
jgi:hypothetical protein